MIPKCGQYIRWHWAHKGKITCDPWQESETHWHRFWKDAFPVNCQEVLHIDDRTGEKHIADIKTPAGLVVEVQHSPISEMEIRSRESFYDKMIWIVDARHQSGWFDVGMSRDLVSCNPIAYRIEWWGSSKLLEKWEKSSPYVYFDIMDRLEEYADGKLWIFPKNTTVPIEQRTLWRLLKFDATEKAGIIAPVRAKTVIEAAMKGCFPLLHKCEEKDAMKYRKKLGILAGYVDEHGNRRQFVSSRKLLIE